MEETCCPLCMEDLDPTDLLLAPRLCQCRFAVCLWCFRRLTEDAAKEGRPTLCPNCRSPYDTDRIAREGRELDPEQLEEVKRKKGKQDEKRRGSASARPRKDLANVRVVQRNLVYVVGLPMECCFEDVLSSQDYIGQFGKIVKISVSRSGPYGSTQAKNGPTGSAYVTFKRVEDAKRCIESIHGTLWEGKVVKACYGTTKYCNAFLKGQACNNTDCLYLHDIAMEEDSYTKEETKSTKFVNLVHAASLHQTPSAVSSTHGAELNSALSGFDQSTDTSVAMDEDLTDTQGWPSLSNSAWSKPQSKILSSQSIPLTDDPQAWPGLPGGDTPSGNVTANPSSAETSESEGDALHGRRSSLSQGTTTMAVKLAQGSTGKDQAKEKQQPKKLTPLSSRHRKQASMDSAGPQSTNETRDGSRLSPPPTPQLQPNRLAQKLMSPDQDEPEEAPHVPAESASTSHPVGYGRTGSVRTSTADSHESLRRHPPGFANPSMPPKSVVPPPPGFADVPIGSAFAANAATEGDVGFGLLSNTHVWDYQPFKSSGTKVNGGSDLRHLPFGPGSQRSQSRFSFAQGRDNTSQQSSSSHCDDRPPESGQNGYSWQFNSIYNGAFSVNGASLYNVAPVSYPSAYSSLKEDWRESEELPAGLALLKRLQAQGGVARRQQTQPGSPPKGQNDIFSDPAIMSATPQGPGWGLGGEVQNGVVSPGVPETHEAPKTPGRRRKSKPTHA